MGKGTATLIMGEPLAATDGPVTVIGGGIVGASVAYHLASLASGIEVVLVDSGEAGGATEAGAGIVSPWLDSDPRPAYRQLTFAAARAYPHLVAELGASDEIDAGYEVVGALHLAPDDRLAELKRQADAVRASDGPEIGEVAVLDAEEATRRFPALDGRAGAVWLSGAARVAGNRMRSALLTQARRAGMRELSGRASLDVRSGRVVGVRVGEEAIKAAAVVLAAGAWSAEIARTVGAEIDVLPQRGQIVHLQVDGADTARLPIIQSTWTNHYLLAFPGSRIVIGATRESVGFDHRITCGGLAQVLAEALDVAPGLRDATVVETRVGFRPTSGDGLPRLGRLQSEPRVIVVTGAGHYGLTVGPYLGRLAAEIVTGNRLSLDISAFDPQR
jgi:D-amino-acid dehydrogenase